MRMASNDIEKLLGLGGVIVVAVGAVLLLLWLSDRSAARHDRMVLGYPSTLFPACHLTGSGPLAALAATQIRLATIYQQVPPQGELAIWLRAFLNELREIMDTAYRVSVIAQTYDQHGQLERLIAEVQQIEAEVAEQITRRMLARDGDAQQELLNGRLAALRLCLREIGSTPEFNLNK